MRERQLDLFASDGDANEPDAEIRPKESSKRRVLKKSLSRYELSVGVGPLERVAGPNMEGTGAPWAALPEDALGPVVEQLRLLGGKTG